MPVALHSPCPWVPGAGASQSQEPALPCAALVHGAWSLCKGKCKEFVVFKLSIEIKFQFILVFLIMRSLNKIILHYI